jgi:putative ABC transport system permease protein
MKQLLKMAWRNLWREKRRTIITLASVFMAVVLAIGMRSFQKGVYGNMISNAIRFSTGYIQLHSKGYWNDKSINNSFIPGPNIWQAVRYRNINLAVPRLESFALAASGSYSKGVEVMGIDPDKEDKMTGLGIKIVEGKYLKATENHFVLIGDGLAKYLHLQLNDTLVLNAKGYHGLTAQGRYRITGIFHFPVQQINNSLIYLTLPEAQTLFTAPNRLTSISILLNNPDNIENTTRNLQSSLGNTLEVMQWPLMNKSLVQEIQGDNAGGIIMLGILYLVVAFGVFGTVLMMTLERKKEFAVMLALGMYRIKLTAIVLGETIFIALLGVFSGTLVIFPALFYLNRNPILLTGDAAKAYQQFGIEPIMPASLDIHIFLNQGMAVLVIALVSAIFPVWYINRFKIAIVLK